MAFDKRKALQSALTFTQQGKWDKAIAEYQAILKADPHDLTVCNNLGDLFARAGKSAEAIEQYLKLGELYRADGLSVKAIAVYKKIIKLDPTRTQALLACADLYEEQGLTGEAKLQLVNVADQYAKAGETPKVIEIYQRLAALDPANHVLLKKLGDLLVKEGRREEAAAQYELAAQAAEAAGQAAESKRLLAKVRELAPDSPQANLAAGEQLLQEGKYLEAVDALLRATGGDAASAKAWRLLGEAYVGLGQSSEAITALEQAVGLGVPEAEVRRPMAKALLLEGHTDEGITLCQQLTEEALARNDSEEAIATCQDLLGVAPQLAPIHAYLVRLLQDLGRDEEARAATWALAAAHEACGETEAAIHVYHQLLEHDPSDAEATARLEVLEAALAPPAEEAAIIPGLDAGPAEAAQPEPAEPAPAELVPAEPSALEFSLEDALALGDAAALATGEESGFEARPAQVFELDESGELAGMGHPFQEAHGAALEGMAGLDVPGIEFPGESLGEDASGLATAGAEGEASGEIAEQLAEAGVYLKYGLTEKARERLLEVVRLVPEHLAAHRQLKALYLERPQVEEACEEILAIARILQARGQHEAAERELQEGLRLAPDHAGLQQQLAELSGTIPPAAEGVAVAEPAPAGGPEGLGFDVPEGFAIVEAGASAAAPSETAPGFELPDLGLPALGGEAGLGADATSVGEEELPAELRALLEEEAGERPSLVVEPGEPGADQAMADDLAEADFYLSQGMVEEARTVHRRMRERDPSHPAVAHLGKQLGLPAVAESPEVAEPEPRAAASFAGITGEAVPGPPPAESPEVMDFLLEMVPEIVPPEQPRAASVPGQARPPEMPPAKFSVIHGGGEAGPDGFVNLGAELEEEMAAEERAASPTTGAPLVEDLLREFQKGVQEHLDEKDFETHYNLGIAYKEMELYDEAIQEFQLSARDPERALACADLLGLCYLAKGDPKAAIREFRAGLQIRGHPREAYQSLQYDLGIAYETHGDLERALESFEALQVENPRFRDVPARVDDLRQRLQRSQVASLPAPPVQTGEPAKRGREKKISFI